MESIDFELAELQKGINKKFSEFEMLMEQFCLRLKEMDSRIARIHVICDNMDKRIRNRKIGYGSISAIQKIEESILDF